jgi:hypothetical protein
MSWECKYLWKEECQKLNRECEPGQKGCVLKGKYDFPFKEENNKKKKTHNGKNHNL